MNDRFCRNVLVAFVASEVYVWMHVFPISLVVQIRNKEYYGDVCMQAIQTEANTALSSQSCTRLRVGTP